MVTWATELEECAEQLDRLHEVARLLRDAGYETPKIEPDVFYIGERLLEVSPPGAAQVRFTVRCRQHDEDWVYAAIGGSIIADTARDLVSTLDLVYGLAGRAGVR